LLRELKVQAPRWSEIVPRLPALAYEVLDGAREGRLEVRMKSADLELIRLEIKRAGQRTVLALIGAALLISSAVIYGLDGFQPTMFAGAPLLSWMLGALGAYLIVAAWPDGD
jgi:ubiquinone biosynthesis protein